MSWRKFSPPWAYGVFPDDEWNGFLRCFLSVIEDCPLVCKAAGLNNVDKVELIREVGEVGEVNGSPSADSPPIVWALYVRDTHIFMMGTNFEKSTKTLAEMIDFGHTP